MTQAKTNRGATEAVCCAKCGSIDIQISAWADGVSDTVADYDGPTDQGWCPECETHDTDFREITAEEAKQIDDARRVEALRRLLVDAHDVWKMLPQGARAAVLDELRHAGLVPACFEEG